MFPTSDHAADRGGRVGHAGREADRQRSVSRARSIDGEVRCHLEGGPIVGRRARHPEAAHEPGLLERDLSARRVVGASTEPTAARTLPRQRLTQRPGGRPRDPPIAHGRGIPGRGIGSEGILQLLGEDRHRSDRRRLGRTGGISGVQRRDERLEDPTSTVEGILFAPRRGPRSRSRRTCRWGTGQRSRRRRREAW